jgi:hypothetical protein
MCKFSTLVWTSSECLAAQYQSPHQFSEYQYVLCRYSHNGLRCANLEEVALLSNEIGVRAGFCPVCKKVEEANNEYRRQESLAKSRYEEALYKAKMAWEEECRKSEWFESMVS